MLLEGELYRKPLEQRSHKEGLNLISSEMNDSFRLNFRAKVLGLASNPTPESILNIISVVKKHEVVREDLVHGLAMDAGMY